MPLEQYGSLIDKLKAEEEERLIRERDAAMQQRSLQADPAFSGGGIPGEESIAQARAFLAANPPPKPGLGLTLGNVLSRLGARFQGRQVPAWVQPDDPMADFREKMAEVIATQGMAGAQARKTQAENNAFSISDPKLAFELTKKAGIPGMHPSQILQNEASAAKMLAEKPSNIEQVLRRQKAEEDVRKLRLENERTGRFTPLEQAGIAEGLKQLHPSQPTPGMEEVPLEQALAEIRSGAPYRTAENAPGIQAGMSSTAPMRSPLPSAASSPAAQTRPDIAFDMAPGGTTLHMKQVPTQEALLAQKQQEAEIARNASALDAETTKKLDLAMSAYNTTERMKSLYNPQQLGIVANIFPQYFTSGYLDEKHFAIRGELAELKAALGFLRSGSNISGIEQELQDDIIPNLMTGKPTNFLYALNRVNERLKTSLANYSKFVSSGRGDIPNIIEEGMRGSQQQNPASPAYNAAVQPAYPRGAPAGLIYDPKIGKWRMP